MSDTGHWNCAGLDIDPDGAVGFVYMIIYTETNQKYIGKKNFKGRGKLNKGKGSNWKAYTGSSTYLNDLIKEKGKDKFLFVILEQYYTVGGLSFAETWSQVTSETPSKNDEYINRFIDKVTWKVTEPVTDRHKKRLKYYTNKYKVKQC
jgi:hypothetical protein